MSVYEEDLEKQNEILLSRISELESENDNLRGKLERVWSTEEEKKPVPVGSEIYKWAESIQSHEVAKMKAKLRQQNYDDLMRQHRMRFQ